MPDYVRHEPGRGYVKVDVPRRKQVADSAIGYLSVALAVLLIGGFVLAVILGFAARAYRFLF